MPSDISTMKKGLKDREMTVWEFVKSHYFLRQLLIAAALGVAIIWGSLKLLDLYTLHGRTITVPELEGHSLKEAREILASHNLRYVVNDSIYDQDSEPGTIAWHNPASGTDVKRNRTIYLTKVAVLPEMVEMPDLTDLSRRQAITILETHGLEVGQLSYQPDIARDAVLKQIFKEGQIEPGTPVQKGTAIDLVLGEGLGENITMVPLVIGMKRDEAVRSLVRAGLNLGEEVIMDESGENLKVYLQKPDPLEEKQYLEAGSHVDLFFRSTDEFDFEEYLEQLLSVPMPNLIGMTPKEVEDTLQKLELEIGMEVFEEGAERYDAKVYRQDPQYQEGMIIPKGESINVWYEQKDTTPQTEGPGFNEF